VLSHPNDRLANGALGAASLSMPRALPGAPYEQHGLVEIAFDRATLQRLRSEARARDVSVARLIANLVQVLADEPSLVGAVLDDQTRGDGS
jgi:hypothetical protein